MSNKAKAGAGKRKEPDSGSIPGSSAYEQTVRASISGYDFRPRTEPPLTGYSRTTKGSTGREMSHKFTRRIQFEVHEFKRARGHLGDIEQFKADLSNHLHSLYERIQPSDLDHWIKCHPWIISTQVAEAESAVVEPRSSKIKRLEATGTPNIGIDTGEPPDPILETPRPELPSKDDAFGEQGFETVSGPNQRRESPELEPPANSYEFGVVGFETGSFAVQRSETVSLAVQRFESPAPANDDEFGVEGFDTDLVPADSASFKSAAGTGSTFEGRKAVSTVDGKVPDLLPQGPVAWDQNEFLKTVGLSYVDGPSAIERIRSLVRFLSEDESDFDTAIQSSANTSVETDGLAPADMSPVIFENGAKSPAQRETLEPEQQQASPAIPKDTEIVILTESSANDAEWKEPNMLHASTVPSEAQAVINENSNEAGMTSLANEEPSSGTLETEAAERERSASPSDYQWTTLRDSLSRESRETIKTFAGGLMDAMCLAQEIYRDQNEYRRTDLVQLNQYVEKTLRQLKDFVLPLSHAELFRAQYPVKIEPSFPPFVPLKIDLEPKTDYDVVGIWESEDEEEQEDPFLAQYNNR